MDPVNNSNTLTSFTFDTLPSWKPPSGHSMVIFSLLCFYGRTNAEGRWAARTTSSWCEEARACRDMRVCVYGQGTRGTSTSATTDCRVKQLANDVKQQSVAVNTSKRAEKATEARVVRQKD